jgi:fumarylacetoacetate (FAA) hydrolase
MKFATLKDGLLDGRLVVVSRDLREAVAAPRIAPTLLDALQRWDAVRSPLQDLSDALNAGRADGTFAFDPTACAAPLPRSPQWLDGSAFLNHGRLMEQAFNTPPIPDFDTVPVMYQGASDDFLGPCDDIRADEAWGIDFGAELAVVTADLPLGTSAEAALEGVRLLMIANDVSLRELIPAELAKGFGFLQGKPATAFGPVAVTPDELGRAWRGGRVHLTLQCDWNGVSVGRCDAGPEMSFHFGQLIAHLCRTRNVRAGSIVGSGAVSNRDRAKGYSCIAEKRAIETSEGGAPTTGFMRHGDTIRIEMTGDDGQSVFGAIEQTVRPVAPVD